MHVIIIKKISFHWKHRIRKSNRIDYGFQTEECDVQETRILNFQSVNAVVNDTYVVSSEPIQAVHGIKYRIYRQYKKSAEDKSFRFPGYENRSIRCKRKNRQSIKVKQLQERKNEVAWFNDQCVHYRHDQT